MTKYIYIQGNDYQRKPTHFMARKMISREPHYIIVAKFTNETEAQNAVDAANMKNDQEQMDALIGNKRPLTNDEINAVLPGHRRVIG